MALNNRNFLGMNKPKAMVPLGQQLTDALLENTAIPPNLLHEDRNQAFSDATKDLLNNWVRHCADNKEPGSLKEFASTQNADTLNLIAKRIFLVCEYDHELHHYTQDAVLEALFSTITKVGQDYRRGRETQLALSTPATDAPPLKESYLPDTKAFRDQLGWMSLPEKLLDCRTRLEPKGWQTAAETIFAGWVAEGSHRPRELDASHVLDYAKTHHAEALKLITDRITALHPTSKKAQRETRDKLFDTMSEVMLAAKAEEREAKQRALEAGTIDLRTQMMAR